MKVRTKITIALGEERQFMEVDGDQEFLSVAAINVFKHDAKNFRVGDYIEGSFGELNRIIEVHSQEYDETETNPDHAIRDSLPKSEVAGA